jgi:hypothetical protein
MTDTNGFTFAEAPIAVPRGAWAGTHRRMLRYKNRPLLALTQGGQRAYVYPLYTPAGFAVTSEAPADHPHHNSFWIASDHVMCTMPAADNRVEEYVYNFYVNDVFQGRAPGRILTVDQGREATGADSHRLTQKLEWRGPVEWAAPEGRLAAIETRTLDITAESGLYIIDVTSRLAADEWDLHIGPTRHSYFNVRVAESIAVTSGGRLIDDQSRRGGDAITDSDAKWIDYSGPVGGGHWAGVAVCPNPADHADISWFVTDWGVVTVGPFRKERREILKGRETSLRYRVLVHDGDSQEADVTNRLADYLHRSPLRGS